MQRKDHADARHQMPDCWLVLQKQGSSQDLDLDPSSLACFKLRRTGKPYGMGRAAQRSPTSPPVSSLGINEFLTTSLTNRDASRLLRMMDPHPCGDPACQGSMDDKGGKKMAAVLCI